MLLRERETPEGLLVSICDTDCLGETFVDDPVSLEVTEEFYGGEEAVEVDDAAVVDGLTRADVANIVGERAVSVAIEAGIVDEERVLEVEGTLHAQLLWM
ncbi:hypothetical protein halTADL_2131 [Halohasta litchfieldiae]|jgi:hypothetical protein|uniref:DUF424 domain-containing protein n=1 Tax=Halohasta litchfieldiae TaxID=1073996 RepID=A0A1H6TVA8_9EURY|nr:DUF424 domain-containing protein [Halohasta litchfieldiae]ATW88878.1 hypothetical protein halTADL_2131 [Halohasta litchfieldiae]SEI80210.1 hypothetical protein SAMN05444271_10892 [Halohasta litchfieldiae]